MEFTIYSIGSAAYLEEILNAVAMISGTGDIEALAKVGMIIGVLILGFQAVMNGTGIQFQKMLVCAIMYLAMYGPTGRALIEDVYTGDVAVVDNVPLGPLAVGSIVSTIGYNITDTFETAFSVPGMTEYGFADPLDTLVKVRKVANNVQSMPSVTGTGNASLLASWANYLRECTLTATNSNPVAMRDVFTNPDAIGAIRFDSSVYYTKIYDGSADGVTLSCRDAYTTLRGATDTAQDAMLDDVAKSFAKPGALLDSTALEARLNNALFSLTGAATDARAYTVTAVLLPILEGAPGQRAIEDMQGAAAIMMGQAIQQQNTQWAAEGSMFTKYIRPFMTFFEGFIYAITPLMAFVIVLGGFGIGLVSKYLLILIWMMLWMPVLSIVNLYTISTTKAKIEGILGSSTFVTEGLSFQNMRDMMPIIETQIGVAGMMASATPALCMFLVYGTSVAASGIASRLNGSDTINEKIASPDVLQPGAGMSMTSQVSSDPTRGSRQTGSEEYRPTINTGSALEKARQSASENLASSSMSYNQAFQKQLGQSVSNASSLAEVAEIGGKVASALGTSSNSGYGAARSQAIAAGYSEQEVDAFTAQVAGGVGAQAGLGKVASADMGGKLQSSTQQSSGSSTQRTDSNAIEQNLRSAIQSSFSKEQAQSTAERLSSSQDFKKDASFTDALSKQSTDLQQSKEAYSNVEAFKQNFGMSSSISLDALANKAIGDGTAGQLVSNLDKLDDKDRAAAAERFEAFKTSNAGTMGNQNATVAAAAYALAGVGRYDLLGDALGAKYEGINPDANAGLEAVGSNGNAAAFDGRGVPQAGFDPNAERSRLISDGQAGVSNFAGAGQSAVEGDFNSRLDSSQANLKDEIGARWRDTGQKTDYDRIMGSNVNMPAWAARAGANSHKEEYELDSMLAAKRREAEDEFGLPPVLAEVSARADIGYLTQQDMGNAVVTLQKEYGMDRNEALGAVEATVTGTYGSKEGGKDFSDIQNYFSGDQVNSALRPDSSTRPPNILGRGVPQAGFDPNAERSRLISDGQAGVSNFAGAGQSAVEGDFNSRLDSSQANLKDEIGARWRDTGQKTDYDRIMGSNVNMPAWAARAGANSHKEEYELDSMLAAKRREAEDEFGLPPVLAEVSARADIGYLTQQDMGNAVVTLQKEYGMDRNEALGAVEATVTGTYGSKEGGKDFSDIQNYFSGDQVNSALRPDSSTRPPNILGRGVPQAGFDPNAERSRLISDGQAGVSNFAGAGQSAVEGDFNSRLDSSQANLKDEIGARWRDTGQKTDYDRIMGSNVNMPAWAARAGANSHKEEYELDSMLAAKRREAEDEFGLPPVLAEVSARADIGYLTQQDMGNAVVTLQKEYGMDRNEALGAVEATVTGTYGSKEGGKDFSDIQNYFSGDQVNSALRPDSSTRPPNILRMTD